MVATAQEYCRTHPDVSISWERRSLQAFADQPLYELSKTYDLLVIDHPHLGSASQNGVLICFDGHKRNGELARIQSESIGLSHLSYHDGQHQWALAIDAASQVSAYRPDLVGTVPSTWNEMLTLAQAGRVLWPAKPVDAVSTFNSLLANLGCPLPNDPVATLSSHQARDVLKIMQDLASHVPPACLDMNPPQILDWLASGENDQYAFCPLLYGYSNYSRPGYRTNLLKFGDALGPGEVPFVGTQLGGAGIAVSSSCAAIEVAVDYSFWIASADCQSTTYFESGGQPANLHAWEDRDVNEKSKQFFLSTRQTLESAWMRPRHNEYLTFQDKAGSLINEFLKGRQNLEEVLGGVIVEHQKAMRHRSSKE